MPELSKLLPHRPDAARSRELPLWAACQIQQLVVCLGARAPAGQEAVSPAAVAEVIVVLMCRA
jgi:hypothetical protein